MLWLHVLARGSRGTEALSVLGNLKYEARQLKHPPAVRIPSETTQQGVYASQSTQSLLSVAVCCLEGSYVWTLQELRKRHMARLAVALDIRTLSVLTLRREKISPGGYFPRLLGGYRWRNPPPR